MRRTMALAALLAIGLAVQAAAQTPPAGPPPPRGGRQAQRNGVAPQGPVANQRAAENRVQEQWNAYVLTQSRKFLDLNQQQVPNFVAKLMALQEVRDQHLRVRRRLLMELAKMTAPNNDAQPADDVLLTKARQLDDLEAQTAQQEKTALADIDAVLTPFQRARFRVFEERMEEQKLKMLETARRNAPGGPGNPPADATAAPAVKPIGRGGGGK